MIYHNVPDREIKKTKIPFVAVATNLETGEPHVFDKGDIGVAVQSSIALPPVFRPVTYEDKILVDGGLSEPVAVNIAKRYNPDFIIAVNIRSLGKEKPIRSMIDICARSVYAVYRNLCNEQSKQADIDIRPDVNNFWCI